MRTTVAVIISVVLCSALLAACGSSSSDSGTTATATVPSGTLGAQGGEHCSAPSGFTQLDAVNMDCDTAAGLARTVKEKGLVTGWRCSTTGPTATCIREGNSRVSFYAAW